MGDATILPPPVSAPATNTNPSSSSNNNSGTGTDAAGIADNFQQFLTLLTTQLQNQNPLDPLDTNQFTQQLVLFAQVEQQLKTNDSLTNLVNIEQSAQSTEALAFVGQTVSMDGSTANFNGSATWNFSSPADTNATIVITDKTGATAYTGNFTITQGNSSFVWDGKGNDGSTWPNGDYTMTITAKDSSGNPVNVSTEVQGRVDSVDLTANPPLLSVGGKTYTVSQVKRVVAPGSTGS